MRMTLRFAWRFIRGTSHLDACWVGNWHWRSGGRAGIHVRVAAVREKNVMEDPSDEMRCCDTCEFYVPHDPRRRDWGFCIEGPLPARRRDEFPRVRRHHGRGCPRHSGPERRATSDE
jgi:hypothetical protein